MNKKKNLNEIILVVETKKIFENLLPWNGLNKESFQKIKENILKNKTYIIRENAENNFDFKQIIPYLIFKYKDKYFVMQRKKTASENRLANLYSIGIGGHIREEDIKSDNIFEWAEREFYEEVNYSGNLSIKEFGILNDDSTDVGKVHLGVVFILEGDSDKISIKYEHKSGKLLGLNEIKKIDQLESWSEFIIEEL